MVLLLQWKILLVVTLVIFLLLLLGVGGGVALLLKSKLEEPDDRQEAGKFLINKFRGGCCRHLDLCVPGGVTGSGLSSKFYQFF